MEITQLQKDMQRVNSTPGSMHGDQNSCRGAGRTMAAHWRRTAASSPIALVVPFSTGKLGLTGCLDLAGNHTTLKGHAANSFATGFNAWRSKLVPWCRRHHDRALANPGRQRSSGAQTGV